MLLGIEPELANVVNSAAAARRLIDEMKSDRLRIVLDPANLAEAGGAAASAAASSREAVDLLADRIVMAHAKDRAADGGVAHGGQGRHRLRPFPLVRSRLRASTARWWRMVSSAEEAAGVAAFLQAQRSAL